MQKTRRTAWLLATGLALVVATTGLPPATATATSTAGPDQAALTGGGRVVTLLTGDRVRVVGEARVVEPGQGRERMVFHTYRADGHDYVVPADAVGLVGSGRLDRRLFDVTALLEFGYDDAARADLPLIVKHRPGVSAAGLSASGARVTGQLPSIAAAAVRAPKGEAGRLWPALVGDGVEAVWLDGQRKVVLDHSVPQIGAPAAWQAGFTGRGVTVGVLDTGIDAAHPDFAGRIAEVRNFTDTPDGGDVIGHGTHVTSIMAGSGAAAGGRYRGVAPEATLLVGKVCTVESCPESALLAGMEWAAAAGARVVNLSIGGADYPGLDPLEEAVNTLTDRHGTLFAIAAGNMGWNGPGTVASPGSAHAALTVGAVDKQDQLADFSGRGPRVGDGAIKPDITAPGVDIVAALASGVPAEPVDGAYTRNSGTSMATPHAAGAAALLAQQHPDWRAGELKAALMSAAQAAADLTPFEQGAGRARRRPGVL